MPNRRRNHLPPLTDPNEVRDAFASGFELHDWEDWLRLTCWAEQMTQSDVAESLRVERLKTASLIIPRSSLQPLLRTLRFSAHNHEPERRHS